MRRLKVFDQVSLDGYFVDASGDMSWAHRGDREWNDFTIGNASGGGVLVFGRVTYEMMASYWPTPQASQANPLVAKRMNEAQKIVFSRTLERAPWSHTRLVKGDLAAEVRKLKQEPGEDMVIMGSGTIVAQLAQAGLIDAYQLVVNPLVLGAGRTLFEGLTKRLDLELTDTRRFANGNVVLWYESAGIS